MNQFQTDRMVIRDFLPADAADLFEILGDGETMRYSEPAYDMEKTKIFLREFCIGRHGAVAAVQKQENKVIGYILFMESVPGVYELGWFFNRSYWGQGYAFEACKAVIDQAFLVNNACKVFAESIDMGKSLALMKKLGMSHEGTQRKQVMDNEGNWADLFSYGLLREEWENR